MESFGDSSIIWNVYAVAWVVLLQFAKTRIDHPVFKLDMLKNVAVWDALL